MLARNLLSITVTLAVALALAVLAFRVDARDLDGRFADSPLKSWFDHLSSGKGLCCSFADGTQLADVDWDTQDGHYRVRIDGEWYVVDDDAVITEPNRAGRTMVWPYMSAGKVSYIRCFMPGSRT